MTHNQRKQQKQLPQAAAKPRTGLGLLRFKAEGSLVTIQHAGQTAAVDVGRGTRAVAVPTLRVDLKTSKVWVGNAVPLPAEGDGAGALTLGIAGLLRLERGSILVLLSRAKRVCSLPDGPVYKVEETQLVAPEVINGCENDLRYASLLQEALSPKCFGSHLYFSHTANITSSRQRQADQDAAAVTAARQQPSASAPGGGGGGGDPAERQGGVGGGVDGERTSFMAPLGAWWDDEDAGGDGGSAGCRYGRGEPGGPGEKAALSPSVGHRGAGGTLWARADPQFTWNRELMQPLIDAGGEAFALPIMAGYVGQATGATFTLRLPAAAAAAASPHDGAHSGGSADEGTERVQAAGAGSGSGGAAAAECRVPGDLTLITRLGAERPVAGSWRRGADRHGHTAGFAETELVLALWRGLGTPQGADAGPQEQPPIPPLPGQPEEPPGQPGQRDAGGMGPAPAPGPTRSRSRVAVASYVMARGSAPLYWSAPPDMRPCPAPCSPGEPSLHRAPFGKHLATLHKAYGRTVLLLNLIHGAHQGKQLLLHDTLQKQVAACTSAASPGGGGAAAASSSEVVSLVGMPLSRGELRELAACGPAAARLERQCARELRAIGAFVSVEELELTPQPEPHRAGGGSPADDSGAAATPAATTGSGSSGSAAPSFACVRRHVHCRQGGVVRLSSASTVSGGGCCEEVDLAQHCLALPVLAEALVALGAMDDAADMARAHSSVMHALALLWSHMADVLSDQAHGTGSGAGAALRSAAAAMEGRGAARGRVEAAVRAPWRRVVAAGDAVSRYYYANFTDAKRQDALDLASGAFKMSSPPAPLPRRQPPNTTFLQLGILLVLAAAVQAAVCAYQRLTSLSDLGSRVAVPAALGVALLADVLRRGRSFVEQPLLQPGAVFPWAD